MKRAQIFDIGLVFVVIGAMVSVMLVVNAVADETSPWASIGQRAYELQTTYARGDAFVSFMNVVARWALADAILELGNNGGFASAQASLCGIAGQHVLWNSKDAKKSCFPSAYESFYAVFGEKVNAALARYQGIPKVPFEYFINGNRLLGISLAPLKLDILKPAEKHIAVQYTGFEWTLVIGSVVRTDEYPEHATGMYAFRPNFEVSFPYDVGVYSALASAVQEVLKDCRVKTSVDEKKSCAQSKVAWGLRNEPGVDVVVQPDANDGDLFLFVITQDGRKTTYTNSQPPVIKFGLYVPTIKPAEVVGEAAPEPTPEII